MFDWIGHIWRLLRVAITLARYDALLPEEYYERYPIYLQATHTLLRVFVKRRRPKTPGARIALALEKLGPAYVKVGQFLATRPDMIGVTAAQDLGRLKDRIPPFSRDKALDTINQELGGTETLFGNISEAMAAASIAQVHQAILPRHGPVAIKVMRPGIEKRLANEMGALRFLAQGIEFFSPSSRRLEPVQFIDTVAGALERELDFRLEAGAAAEFKDVARADGYLTVPEIDWSRSSKRVMTLDWIDGVPLTDMRALERAGADRPALAISVTRGFLAAALDHGFFHADMHEGNFSTARTASFGLSISASWAASATKSGAISRKSSTVFCCAIIAVSRKCTRSRIRAGKIHGRRIRAGFARYRRAHLRQDRRKHFNVEAAVAAFRCDAFVRNAFAA